MSPVGNEPCVRRQAPDRQVVGLHPVLRVHGHDVLLVPVSAVDYSQSPY